MSLPFYFIPAFLATSLVCFVLFVREHWFQKEKTNLKLQNSMLLGVLDSRGVGLAVFDQDKKFLRLNDQMIEIIPEFEGLEFDDFTLWDFLDYLYDRSVELEGRLKETVDSLSEDRAFNGFYDVIRSLDDRLCLVEMQNTACGYHIVVLTDLSAQQRQQEKLSRLTQSNFELEKAVDSMISGVVIAAFRNDDYVMLYGNKSFCKMTNLEKSGVSGESLKGWLKTFCDKTELKEISNSLDSAISYDRNIQVKKFEKPLWYNIKITPINLKKAQGKSGPFVIVFSDISDLKVKEEALLQSQKLEALGQLAAGVAHDFNNILSIMDGYAQIAQNHLNDPSRVSDFLTKIDMAAKRGAALTRQMLVFGKHKISSDNIIDMVVVVNEQEPLFEPMLSKRIELSVLSQEDSIAIEFSKDSLEQVLMNLVINAVDAMPEGGEIKINVGRSCAENLPEELKETGKEYACLSVEDNGQGIEDKVLKRIFDPFFTTKEQGKGTGLGLFMIYGKVRDAGGATRVHSVKGKGTRFDIFLPASDKEPDKVIEGSMEDVKSIRMKGHTVLIVDDEEDLVEIVANTLKKTGVNVITATNGNDALVKQEEFDGEIDLLLTDVLMPELDGVKLSELFVSLRPNAKILFMSAYPSFGRESSQLIPDLPESGAFLAKPFDNDELIQCVYRVLHSGKYEEAGRSSVTTSL